MEITNARKLACSLCDLEITCASHYARGCDVRRHIDVTCASHAGGYIRYEDDNCQGRESWLWVCVTCASHARHMM